MCTNDLGKCVKVEGQAGLQAGGGSTRRPASQEVTAPSQTRRGRNAADPPAMAVQQMRPAAAPVAAAWVQRRGARDCAAAQRRQLVWAAGSRHYCDAAADPWSLPVPPFHPAIQGINMHNEPEI